MNKKFMAFALSAMMLAGCGSSAGSASTAPADSTTASGKGRVYYLNFKPEADEYWQQLAKEYTQ